jgi:hypothetical protein
MDEPAGWEPHRRGATSRVLCHEVIRVMDRVFAAEGPDEPDLGVNVVYVMARRKLERLASAEVWVVPAATERAIRSRLRSIASIDDPLRLEAELLSIPSRVIDLLDRRTRVRPTMSAGHRRRIGDRQPTQTAAV